MRVSIRVLIPLLLLLSVAVAEEPPANPAPPAGAKRPLLDEILEGRITALDGDMIEIRYDFSDEAQLSDWVFYKAFRVLGEWECAIEGNALKLKGVGALRHRLTFLKEVEIEYDLVPRSDRDLGSVVSEDAESEQFVLFSLNDIYFQRFDGARTPQHMITRFGIADSSIRADEHAFRYVARGADPRVQTHQKIHLRASKNGPDDKFLIGEREYKGIEPGRPISQLLVGLYLVKSSGLFDDVVVRGRISPVWVEREKVELALSAPIGAVPVGPSEADKTAQEKLTRYAAGTGNAEELLNVLGETGVSEPIRQAAADALAASGAKSLVPKALSLLYSEDLASRRLGDQVIRALTGKSFGFDPKADADRRSAAIQKLVQYIRKNPALFGVVK